MRCVYMAETVKAKLLLGWMKQSEAVKALNSCVFEEHLTQRKAVALWKKYRDRVLALEPRNPMALPALPFTNAEQQAIENHIRRVRSGPNGRFFSEVIKIHPGDLVARQFHVLTEHSEQYAQGMQNDAARINACLGIGLEFNGQLVLRQVSPKRAIIDLPHPEFVVVPNQVGIHFQERDRYIVAVRTAGDRILLWGGYHRTHALLCHMAGDAAGTAPLLTVMTGIPEVEDFLARPSPVRDTVLGERPALLRDFLNDELFIAVNLLKKRAEGRIEQIRPGKFRAGVFLVNDDT